MFVCISLSLYIYIYIYIIYIYNVDDNDNVFTKRKEHNAHNIAKHMNKRKS